MSKITEGVYMKLSIIFRYQGWALELIENCFFKLFYANRKPWFCFALAIRRSKKELLRCRNPITRAGIMTLPLKLIDIVNIFTV